MDLVRSLQSCELALAEVLGEMARTGEFHRYASSMGDYASSIGLGRGKGRQLTVIGLALPELPGLHHVMREGRLAWTAAFEVARVATAETELGWLRVAEAWPVRELRAAVVSARKGETAPAVEERPGLGMTTLRFELVAEDAQLVSRAMTLLRSRATQHGGAPSDEELLLEMARIVVSNEAPEVGVSSERFLTVIRECPACETAELAGLPDGQRATVTEATREMARCDAVVVDEGGRQRSTVTPRIRRLVMERHNHRCAVPGCSNWLHLDVHHVVHRQHGGSNHLANLIVLCGGCHRRSHRGFLQIGGDAVSGFTFGATREGDAEVEHGARVGARVGAGAGVGYRFGLVGASIHRAKGAA